MVKFQVDLGTGSRRPRLVIFGREVPGGADALQSMELLLVDSIQAPNQLPSWRMLRPSRRGFF